MKLLTVLLFALMGSIWGASDGDVPRAEASSPLPQITDEELLSDTSRMERLFSLHKEREKIRRLARSGDVKAYKKMLRGGFVKDSLEREEILTAIEENALRMNLDALEFLCGKLSRANAAMSRWDVKWMFDMSRVHAPSALLYIIAVQHKLVCTGVEILAAKVFHLSTPCLFMGGVLEKFDYFTPSVLFDVSEILLKNGINSEILKKEIKEFLIYVENHKDAGSAAVRAFDIRVKYYTA